MKKFKELFDEWHKGLGLSPESYLDCEDAAFYIYEKMNVSNWLEN